MDVSFTTMSKNGQVVIPSSIRKQANLSQSSKFLVVQDGKNIILKQVDAKSELSEMELYSAINRSEDQIRKKDVLVVDSSLSDEIIDELLMQ